MGTDLIIFALILFVTPVTAGVIAFIVMRGFRNRRWVNVSRARGSKWKLPVSIGIGILFSLIWLIFQLLTENRLDWGLFSFISLFLLTTAFFYTGLSLGLGRDYSEDWVTPAPQDQVTPQTDLVLIDEKNNSIKVTVHTKKRWLWFLPSMLQWILMAILILPIMGIFTGAMLQQFLPEDLKIIAWVVVAVPILYLLYTKFLETWDYVCDSETIEFDNLSVRVEKKGFCIKVKKSYPARKIQKITAGLTLQDATSPLIMLAMRNYSSGSLVLWKTNGIQKVGYIGRGISSNDVQIILAKVYRKYPQYRGAS